MTTAPFSTRSALRNTPSNPRTRRAWASDDRTDALLNDLLDDTREAAEAEAAEIQRLRDERALAQTLQAARTDEVRRQTGDALLLAEAHRRRDAEARRSLHLQAITPAAPAPTVADTSLEALHHQLALAEAAREAAELEAARLVQQARTAAARTPTDAWTTPVPRTSRAIFAAAAVAVLLLAAVAGYFAYASTAAPTTTPTAYAVTALTAHDLRSPSVVKDFEPVEPAAIAATEPTQPGRAQRPPRTHTHTTTHTTTRNFDFDAGSSPFDGNKR